MQLEENKKYKVEQKGERLEFFVTSIDREKDEVYIKIVHPICSYTGLRLSSVENNRLKCEEVKQ
jgi:hypothetical protein